MNPKEYTENVLKTELRDMDPVVERLENVKTARMLHCAMGMQTETAEITDALKKHIFYGKELDVVNVKEEIGDTLFYIAALLDVVGSSFEEVMATNIAKLRARYGEKFSEEKALHRNLDVERAILEK